MLQPTYGNRHSGQFDIDRAGAKLGVRQDAVETLHDIQITKPRGDQYSFTAAQRRRDGTLGAQQRFAQLDVATKTSLASLLRFSGAGSGTMSQFFSPV